MTTNTKDKIQHIRSRLKKKVSLALLSGAAVLQSTELANAWANSYHTSDTPVRYEYGDTALHVAVRNSWPEAAELLLVQGASVQSTNNEQLSVVTLARNIYREYENKAILATSQQDEKAILTFAQAKQVLDVLDKYKYADGI